MSVHSITVHFDVNSNDAKTAASVLCEMLVEAELVKDPIESWSFPYFPEVDGSDRRDRGEEDRQRCGCPFDYHMADCPIVTDRSGSGESEMGMDPYDDDRPERIPTVECRYCKRHLDPDYDDDWDARTCEECAEAEPRPSLTPKAWTTAVRRGHPAGP